MNGLSSRSTPSRTLLAVAALTLLTSGPLAGCATTESAAPVTKRADEPAEVVDGADATEDEATPEDEATTTDDSTANLGDTVAVGDWEVTVDRLTMDAFDILKKANQFNEKPKDQYVMVDYTATYTGAERTADAEFDLTWSFTSNDNQVLDPTSVVTPSDNNGTTEARTGGSIQSQVVFDIAQDRMTGGLLTVETYDENFDLVFADFAVD